MLREPIAFLMFFLGGSDMISNCGFAHIGFFVEM